MFEAILHEVVGRRSIAGQAKSISSQSRNVLDQ